MVSKKALIITYYWPPGGGAGVQRWLKFVKYLREFGWEPVIYTPENGEMPVIDSSLEKDVPDGVTVIRRPIWEPYSLYKKFVGAGKDEKINTGFLTEKKRPGLAEKLSVWMRGNLFIPDARKYWIKPSVKFLRSYLKKNPVDVIISTGPPHSMHMIALPLSRELNVPWVADFRDPWTNIDYYKDLKLTKSADRKHHQMEKEVVTGATGIVVVGQRMKEEFESEYNRPVRVITNGYDADDIKSSTSPEREKFIVAHVGTLVPSRNAPGLWKALGELVKEDPGFASKLSIRLTGKVDVSVKDSVRTAGLEPYVVYIDYLPHAAVGEEQQRASLLLLVLNNTENSKGILTGKMFEYLASRRPVLCVGPVDGDAAGVITETGAGTTCEFGDVSGMKKVILEQFNNYLNGKVDQPNSNVEKYSRKNLTGELAEFLNEMISDR